VEVDEGVYAWDGSLLSNTPLREVIDASPAKDKRVFLVENYPRYSERLPDNLLEVEHRVRDIMFCDKTLHNKKLAKAITYYLGFIDELYHVIEDRFDLENVHDKEKFEKIKAKYKKISEEHGAQVKDLYYISRDEPFPDLYENADFSIDTIKASIRDGNFVDSKEYTKSDLCIHCFRCSCKIPVFLSLSLAHIIFNVFNAHFVSSNFLFTARSTSACFCLPVLKNYSQYHDKQD
jgi:hypothetical protein